MLELRVALQPAEPWHPWACLVRVYIWHLMRTGPDTDLQFGPGKALLPRSDPAGNTVVHSYLIRYGPTAVGAADIYEDRPHQVCTLVLGLLPSYRGKGIGTIAGRCLLRESFTKLKARRVESSAISSNRASLAMQDGMIEEARFVERFLIRGQLYDEVRFRLLRREWDDQLADRERRRGSPGAA